MPHQSLNAAVVHTLTGEQLAGLDIPAQNIPVTTRSRGQASSNECDAHNWAGIWYKNH